MNPVVRRRSQGWIQTVTPNGGDFQILEVDIEEPSVLTLTPTLPAVGAGGGWRVETLVDGGLRQRVFGYAKQGICIPVDEGRTRVFATSIAVEYKIRAVVARGVAVQESVYQPVTLPALGTVTIEPIAYARALKVWGFESPGVIFARTSDMAAPGTLAQYGLPIVAFANTVVLNNSDALAAHSVCLEWEVVS